jgi:hypothetical protein
MLLKIGQFEKRIRNILNILNYKPDKLYRASKELRNTCITQIQSKKEQLTYIKMKEG